ncbi:MAG: ATP-grasp domain-containing protein [Acidobacteriota bacterium]
MRTVVFVAPFVFETTFRFVDAASRHPNIRLVLVTQDRRSNLPHGLEERIAARLFVDDALDWRQLVQVVEEVQTRVGPVHRLLGTLEQLQVPLARAREACSLPGLHIEAATNFRDKAQMKDVLRAAGLPCARHRLITSAAEARDFARDVGYPQVIKPPAGAGSKGTYQVEGERDLAELLERHPPHPSRPLLAEEFVLGEEHSFDGVLIDGELAWHSLTHYLPAPLDVVRNPWIQWCVLLPREVDDPRYDDIRAVATDAVRALGLDTGVFHLEWFRRGDGSIALSEVGARPGGAQISKLMSYAHDFSFYRAWAQVAIDAAIDPPERRYAAGAAFLRGQGRGKVKAVRGLREAQEKMGHLVIETNLPRLGQSPSTSYEGEGYVILRHPDTEIVREALRTLISLVRVELG